MTKITLFTAPKPFTNPHIRTIQRNAIQSWMHLGDQVEVVIIGEEDGLAETAQEFGLKHYPDVERSAWGTPYVSSIFQLARDHSDAPLLAYVNADILFMPDFITASNKVITQVEKFLMLGQRWDLDITTPYDFGPGWDERLRALTLKEGALHPPAGSDYFLFPREVLKDIPDFSIGRPGWDNWMIYHSLQQGWPVIDATHDVMIVHQNHDYSHLPGGLPPYNQAEGNRNIELARGPDNKFTGYKITESSHQLVDGQIKPTPPSLMRTLRKMEISLLPTEKTGLKWRLVRLLRRLQSRVG